jgi:nitric oxide reductase NorD protein
VLVSEPEDLILDGAHVATQLAREMWRRRMAAAESPQLGLERVRLRLEMFLRALFGQPIAIGALEPPPPATWLSRLAKRTSSTRAEPLCGTDGERVYLAPALSTQESDEEAFECYRLFAVQQAARLVRHAPAARAGIVSPVLADLYRLTEAAVIDAWIARIAPGLLPALTRVRAKELARRVRIWRGPPAPAELAIRRLLSTDPGRLEIDLTIDSTPDEWRAWVEHAPIKDAPGDPYRRVPAVLYWGEVFEPSQLCATATRECGRQSVAPVRPPRLAEMRRRPRPRQATDDEDDAGSGSWVIRADEPQESVEDPFGLQRPADRDQHVDPDGLADSLSELPEARVVRTSDPAREVLRAGDPPRRLAGIDDPASLPDGGISYPEWDYRTRTYRRPGAVVRQPAAPQGSLDWVAACLSRHRALALCVRRRFECVRPRPMRFFRQVDGEEIDIAAYVIAACDRRAGVAMDGRLYVDRRAARRELAVALLLDVSASTDGWVSANQRIVDVEKDAALIVCEALDALGDGYALFAFSGEGPDHVRVVTLKGFTEPSTLLVRRRIAGMEADGYTRLGAALRHVTATLCRQPAASRLLLLLSDGKPNDVDLYEGTYGVEDTRQAVAEARRQGTTVFCLTVDRRAPEYAGRIFGPKGFSVLHKPNQLPRVLVEVLRHLVRA